MVARTIVPLALLVAHAALAQGPDSLMAAARSGDARAAFRLGVSALRADKLDDATNWFRRSVDLADEKSLYHLWLGYAYDLQRERANVFRMPGLASKAKAEFERAVALDSNNVDARVRLGTKYLYMPRIAGGSLEKAQAQAAAVRRLNPYQGALFDAAIAMHTGDRTAAKRGLESLMAANPDSTIPVLRLADAYVQMGQSDSAIALLTARITRVPSDTVASRALARIR